HRRARGCADGDGAILAVEAHPLRLETFHRREADRVGHPHVRLPLVHAEDEEVGPILVLHQILESSGRFRSLAAMGKRMANPTREATTTITTVSGCSTACV